MAEKSDPRLAWTLVACILASSLAFIDGSVVNVALSAIGDDLDASAADLQWTVNAYTLPLSALLLIGGAAGDHFGRRAMLIGGIVLFAVASLACAVAPTLPWLLAARAVQGVGAAMLMPNSLSILSHAFSGEAKGRAVGTWAAAGAIFGAAGPPIGGWLVEVLDWRAVFYVNIPVSIAAILVAMRAVAPDTRDKRPLDWPGAALATLALGGLTWALTLWSSEGGMTLTAWIGLGAGLAALAAYLVTERRRGDAAMMPTALFGTRAFVGLTLYTFLLYAALGGLIVLLPYILIHGGYTPFQAGSALLPFAIGVGFGSRIMGKVAQRIGPRWPLTIGPLITAAGFALLVLVDPRASYWTSVLPGMATIAAGMALAVAPLTTAVLSAVDDEHTGTASGFNSAIARTGGLIATALSGGVIGAAAGELLGAFHAAALVGSAMAVLAAASSFFTLGEGRRPARAPDSGHARPSC